MIWYLTAEKKFHYISVFRKTFMINVVQMLIQIFNRLGLCICHDKLERTDCCLANEIVNSCIEFKVLLSPTITSASIIHGEMHNFDHNKNTLSGKGSSHDS